MITKKIGRTQVPPLSGSTGIHAGIYEMIMVRIPQRREFDAAALE
jgi:hypothetical protein